VAEANHWAAEFNSRLGRKGIRAECVKGETSWIYNREVLRDFRDGKVRVLTNVYYVTEGFDMPEVGCVILARRFQFRSTYMQFVGRALRPAPGKEHATLIDLTSCARVHGVPDFDLPWDLSDHEPTGSLTGDETDSSDEDNEGCSRRQPLTVSGEGLMPLYPLVFREKHGKEIAEGPPREPVFPDLLGKTSQAERAPSRETQASQPRAVDRMSELENRSRQKSATKGATTGRRWLERERRRRIEMVDH
jgi:superfamily II DNA or RNA helicase